MIKKIRFSVNNDIDLCNDNKPCKFIILIGNNSTGKTYTIENLNKDFEYNASRGKSCFKYTFLVGKFDSSTSGWQVAPILS
jgi:predicted ATPase